MFFRCTGSMQRERRFCASSFGVRRFWRSSAGCRAAWLEWRRGTAHYWARELRALGHEVRLMPAQYVKAYVKRNKNDAADAAAICEAVVRPTMRFVAVKTVEQNGGVWDGALLGARVACAWPRGAADAGEIRAGLCEAQQERRGGCCGDLRGGCAADDAVCGGEDGRAAGRGAAAPWPR